MNEYIFTQSNLEKSQLQLKKINLGPYIFWYALILKIK